MTIYAKIYGLPGGAIEAPFPTVEAAHAWANDYTGEAESCEIWDDDTAETLEIVDLEN